MKQSESIANLAMALSKAQAEMEGARKSAENDHFHSKYADLSAVVDAIRGPLTSNGLAWMQFVVTVPEGVGVETQLTHSSGEWVRGDPFAVPVEKRSAHGFGSALTYARRYSLAAACGLKADDDDGNAASDAPPEAPRQRPGNIPQRVIEEYKAKMSACKTREELRTTLRAALTLAHNSEDKGAYQSFLDHSIALASVLEGAEQ